MYDYIRLRAAIRNRDQYMRRSVIPFMGIHDEETAEVKPKSFSRSYRGLKTNVYTDSIRVDGSIQTFCNTDNFSDFTRSDLVSACDELARTMQLKESDLHLKRFEASLTIESEPIYKYMQLFKGRYACTDMAKNNAVYGKRFVLGNADTGSKGEYGGKCYDKTKQVLLQSGEKLNKQLQHFELCVDNVRWFNNRHPQYKITTLNSLYNLQVMAFVGEELLEIFHNLTFAGAELDFNRLNDLNPSQVGIVVAMANEGYAAHLKANHPETYKKYFNLFKRVKSNNALYRNVQEIESFGEKVVQQIAYIINN